MGSQRRIAAHKVTEKEEKRKREKHG